MKFSLKDSFSNVTNKKSFMEKIIFRAVILGKCNSKCTYFAELKTLQTSKNNKTVVKSFTKFNSEFYEKATSQVRRNEKRSD